MAQHQSNPQCLSIDGRHKKVIYDFGSNNGDDIPYYLKKGDVVIAVEANPVLCKKIETRFEKEIEEERLFVENCVLTTDDSAAEVYFYIHKSNHVLSQFPEPESTQDFEKVLLPSKSVMHILKEYEEPYYIKIDIEHYDQEILRSLFENDVRPPFISAESHDIEVFSLLVCLGGYNSFKLVDGYSVSTKYHEHKIFVNDKAETYSFPFHSAGPFGDDVSGEWMSANNFYRLLAFENLGWKDIHATNQYPPNPASAPRMESYFKDAMQRKMRSLVPAPIKRIIKRFI